MAAKKKTTTKAATRPADGKAWVEPSIRVFTDWTPRLIRYAEISADQGNLRQAANLCDWILGDDRVASTLNTRVQALLGLEPDFEASGDKRRSARAVKALDAGEDWWEAYPEAEIAQTLRWGLMLGAAPARQPWVMYEDRGRLLPRPEFWHPQNLRYDWPTRRWLIRVAATGMSSSYQEVELVPGDGEWILHTPFGKNRPWSMGLWRGLARLVLLKHLAEEDWSRVGEKGAIIALTMPLEAAANLQGNTSAARRQLAQDIYDRGREAVAALPPGMDLKLVEAQANTEALYNAQIKMANTAIAILIRGGNLGTETKEGSLAAAESQERTGDLGNLRFDAQAWTTTARDQSLVWWAQYNYGDSRLAPWPIYPVEPKANLKDKADTTQVALTDLEMAESLGFDVDRKAFLDEYEIRWAKPGKKLAPLNWNVAPPGKDAPPDPNAKTPPDGEADADPIDAPEQ